MTLNKKYLIAGGIVVGLILVWILFIGFSEDLGDGMKKSEGILTESLFFSEDAMQGKVIKNKLTNTAILELTYSINDTDEYTDFLGETITSVPFLVNVVCNLFAIAFFNETALQELSEEGNMTLEEGDLTNFLEGTDIEYSSILFKDKETNEKIAECKATGETWEDIKFTAYRDYSNVNSFFGMKIGEKFEE